ncbi:hypothetical protein VTK56DRAFT_2496 [Thermocarpiscus australiensis]
MRGRPVDQLVYEYMFPKPRQSDPENFHALLQRYLIPEVRHETHSFYGHIDTPEAKYPGLDYTHPIHRIRLSRWPWHRRLFRAFDGLHLTHAEISGLTKWEGTKWAKERFEREQGIVIRDTTADGIPSAAELDDLSGSGSERAESEETEEPAGPPEESMEENAEDSVDEESDEELESVGVDLNARLRERVALRNMSGDNSMPLDEEWENWLKYAIESGELPHVADQIARFPGARNTLTADDIFPPRMMAAARAGHWDEIPEFLRDMIRQALESGRRSAEASTAASSDARPAIRYSVGVFGRDSGNFSGYRPQEIGGSRASQSGARPQQTAQPGA